MTAEAASPKKTRRSGGRQARQALRASKPAAHLRPVRGGLESGWYKALSDGDVGRIHQTALSALAEIGFGDPTPSCVDVCTAAGAELGSDGRLRFPKSLVEDTIAGAGRGFHLYGQDEAHDLLPQGKHVYYGTAGAATQVVDIESNSYRDSVLKDLYDAARIVDAMDNIHFFQRSLIARDLEDLYELDLNTLYACVAGTSKHVGTAFTVGENVQGALEMLHEIAGGEAAWRARPFVSCSNCFVVPPMKFAADACDVLEACVRGGMPVLLLSAGQAGATAPASLAGAVVQAVSEVLAGLVYVNAIEPGAPAIFGTWPFVSDLRTGSMSGGSGEQALLTAACGQMAHFYDLPGGAAAGMADAKMPDAQAGYEKAVSNTMAGLAGVNMIYESAGMLASLLGFCFESLIIDNDMIGQCLRTVRGIEVSEGSLSLETMRSVCLEGPGHYLGHERTLELMEREFVYPNLADRSSPKEWVENSKPELLVRARAEKDRLLASHFPRHIADTLDKKLRGEYPIRLERAQMGFG
jgi:trimethylamine--corrinoid protein Co-methyltransferase